MHIFECGRRSLLPQNAIRTHFLLTNKQIQAPKWHLHLGAAQAAALRPLHAQVRGNRVPPDERKDPSSCKNGRSVICKDVRGCLSPNGGVTCRMRMVPLDFNYTNHTSQHLQSLLLRCFLKGRKCHGISSDPNASNWPLPHVQNFDKASN